MLLLLRKGVTVNVDVMDTFSVDDNMDGMADRILRSTEPLTGTEMGNERKGGRKEKARDNKGQQKGHRDRQTGGEGEGEGGSLTEPETLTGFSARVENWVEKREDRPRNRP